MPRVGSQVVPSTNWVVAFIALGLDLRYQRYHLSGFLTLQAPTSSAPRLPTAPAAARPRHRLTHRGVTVLRGSQHTTCGCAQRS